MTTSRWVPFWSRDEILDCHAQRTYKPEKGRSQLLRDTWNRGISIEDLGEGRLRVRHGHRDAQVLDLPEEIWVLKEARP